MKPAQGEGDGPTARSPALVGCRPLHVRDLQREFSAHRARGEALAESGGRAPHDLLELLGQLTRHHDLDLAERLTDGLERGEHAMRRLVADDGHLEIAERLETVHALARLDRS